MYFKNRRLQLWSLKLLSSLIGNKSYCDRTKTSFFCPFRFSEEKNFIEAASNGASIAISLVANIGANLIAFIALLHFVDSTLTWLGHRADLYDPEVTFQVILFLTKVYFHADKQLLGLCSCYPNQFPCYIHSLYSRLLYILPLLYLYALYFPCAYEVCEL